MKGKGAAVAVLILLLLASCLLQAGFDRTPAGSARASRDFEPTASSLLDFLGGIRQYLAYTLYIKSDKLYHSYFGDEKSKSELVSYLMLISMMDPNYVDAFFEGAGLMYELGRKDEAIEFNRRGIRANPQSADLYFSLGDIYIAEGKFEEAREALEKAMLYDPEILSRFLIMRALATTYQRLGDPVKFLGALADIVAYFEILKYNRALSSSNESILIKETNTLLNNITSYEKAVSGPVSTDLPIPPGDDGIKQSSNR
jgi:tetratricopeptide (TPR) repeat protein